MRSGAMPTPLSTRVCSSYICYVALIASTCVFWEFYCPCAWATLPADFLLTHQILGLRFFAFNKNTLVSIKSSSLLQRKPKCSFRPKTLILFLIFSRNTMNDFQSQTSWTSKPWTRWLEHGHNKAQACYKWNLAYMIIRLLHMGDVCFLSINKCSVSCLTHHSPLYLRSDIEV